MHIPDGFLDTRTIIATTTLSTAGVGIALQQMKSHVEQRRVPLVGLAAAFVFAAQMINFPVAAGTSGHLMGAVLAAVLLGPAAGVVVMTAVLIVQCLLFADGGLLVLGANVFNMAIMGPLGGYGVYRLLRPLVPGTRGIVTAAACAAWCSTVLAATCCAGELAWSGTVDWRAAFPAMANIHMLVGTGEGIITGLVLAAIARTRPDLLEGSVPSRLANPGLAWIAYGLLVATGLLLFVSPFASSWPDGLESVARTLGFEQRALTTRHFTSPMTDYQIPGIGSPVTATILAGCAGAIVVFFAAYVVSRKLVPHTQPPGREL
jgi:cobalt/nickel transport system permease protein